MEYVQENKIKTNVKIKVTPEQSKEIQGICFDSGIGWGMNGLNKSVQHLEQPFLFIHDKYITFAYFDKLFFDNSEQKEIDADLFIRTNGTCEEINSGIDYETLRVSHFVSNSKYEELEGKLKKKNEILKKARIKRKNQREELNKLNLKLQKCIDLEAHNIATQKLRDTVVSLRDEVISKVDNMRDTKNKEIEKLKAVIEYLESKAK